MRGWKKRHPPKKQPRAHKDIHVDLGSRDHAARRIDHELFKERSRNGCLALDEDKIYLLLAYHEQTYPKTGQNNKSTCKNIGIDVGMSHHRSAVPVLKPPGSHQRHQACTLQGHRRLTRRARGPALLGEPGTFRSGSAAAGAFPLGVVSTADSPRPVDA